MCFGFCVRARRGKNGECRRITSVAGRISRPETANHKFASVLPVDLHIDAVFGAGNDLNIYKCRARSHFCSHRVLNKQTFHVRQKSPLHCRLAAHKKGIKTAPNCARRATLGRPLQLSRQ